MKLIDADDMIKSLMDMTYYDDEGHTIHDYEDRLAIVKGFVDSVPTVDAVPVIRCKDCKYYKWEIDMCNLPGATVFPMNVVHEDDYCSRAERKEE